MNNSHKLLTIAGRDCLIVETGGLGDKCPPEIKFRAIRDGWRCGYALLDPGAPFYGKGINDDEIGRLLVHGGITYAEMARGLPGIAADDPRWALGFDCAHFSDDPDKCNEAFVIKHLAGLIEQIELLRGFDAQEQEVPR